ncbi:hypothetical protein AB0M39_21300 [Streptomyces sp. NPDC051907]|uniref:hypothetical protein n=1 Tax=Streptomyces sp. NPDC051907 TaxID=3155284 RepID=UPI00341BDE9D
MPDRRRTSSRGYATDRSAASSQVRPPTTAAQPLCSASADSAVSGRIALAATPSPVRPPRASTSQPYGKAPTVVHGGPSARGASATALTGGVHALPATPPPVRPPRASTSQPYGKAPTVVHGGPSGKRGQRDSPEQRRAHAPRYTPARTAA